MKAKRPSIIKFEGLQPNMKYVVKITPYSGDLVSSFRTMKLDTDEKDLKICWISCNDAQKYNVLKDRNLWYFLKEEV